MKKISALIVTAILLVSSVIVPASAYGKAHSRNCTITCTGFVDTDRDGVCDNKKATDKKAAKKKAAAKKNAAAKKKAAAKKNAAKKQNCTRFVDKNNDGICDNRTFAGKGYGCCRNR